MGSKPSDEDSQGDETKRRERIDDAGNVSKESKSRKWTKKEMEEAEPLPLPDIPDDSPNE